MSANAMPGAPWHIRALRGVLRALPRGRYSALSALAAARGRFTSTLAGEIGGAQFACDLSDQLSREVCFTGLYEPPATRIFQQYLAPGGVVVDAGANWGYFSLIAAAGVGPAGRVFALEPDPRQFAALARNIAMNGFRHVETLPIAASARDGSITLVGYADTDANRGVSSIAIGRGGAEERRFEVRCGAIDDLTGDIARVDLVKIDVEGAEDLVLAGMREGLASHRYRAVLLELHPALLRGRGIDPETCTRALQRHGYRGWTIDASAAAYRRAIDPSVPVDALLQPLESWRGAAWPHLLWLC